MGIMAAAVGKPPGGAATAGLPVVCWLEDCRKDSVALVLGEELAVQVTPSTATKCERCWHWRDDVGHDPAHPTICGRCTRNLHGAGEARTVA